MSVCLFLSFRFPSNRSSDGGQMAKVDGLLRATPKLLKALVHTPSRANDPYLDDGPPPQLVLQLYFAELPDLEAALARDGHLSVLLSRDAHPDLASADVAQQAHPGLAIGGPARGALLEQIVRRLGGRSGRGLGQLRRHVRPSVVRRRRGLVSQLRHHLEHGPASHRGGDQRQLQTM